MDVVDSVPTPALPPVQHIQPLQPHRNFRPQGLELITRETDFESSFISWKGIKITSSSTQSFSLGVVGTGHFVLPDNTKLISALYYIRFNAREETTNYHVSLELQHCACVVKDSQNTSRFQFVLAKLPSVSLPYKLALITEQMSTSISSQSGVVYFQPCQSSSHGYLVGIVKPWSRYWMFASSSVRSKYYLRVIGRPVNESEYEMHIVVVKEIAPYIQVRLSKGLVVHYVFCTTVLEQLRGNFFYIYGECSCVVA